MNFFDRAKNSGYSIPDLTSNANYFPHSNCKILDGKMLSKNLLDQTKEISKNKKNPCLAVILVGEDTASHVYVNNKVKTFTEAGFESQSFYLKENEISEDHILNLIKKLNEDEKIDGILVQLPLPKQFSSQKILNAIDPKKDVDGFLAANMGSLTTGEFSASIACTPYGIMILLKAYGVELEGKNAVVIGRSNIVGKPIALLLLAENATVTIAHSKTKNLKEICRQADILIAAAGQPELIKKDFIKNGAVVIDVGIHRKENKKLCGDVAEEVKEVASALSPVPGGVGPMTISCLLMNTAIASWNK